MLVKPALGCCVGQREVQPDERLGAGLIGNLEPGRETSRIERYSRRARQQLVGADQRRAYRIRRLTRLAPAATRRQGAWVGPLTSAGAIDSEMGPGGTVPINSATPQSRSNCPDEDHRRGT